MSHDHFQSAFSDYRHPNHPLSHESTLDIVFPKHSGNSEPNIPSRSKQAVPAIIPVIAALGLVAAIAITVG
jgi:hypothetical protein